MNLDRAVNIEDLRVLARRRLPRAIFDFFDGGAEDETTLRGNRAVAASLSAITAAVVGVILNLAVFFGIHVLFREVRSFGMGLDLPVLASIDWRAAFLAAVAALLLFKLKQGMLTTLGICAALGVAIRLFL